MSELAMEHADRSGGGTVDLVGLVIEPFDVFYRRELRPVVGLAYVLTGRRSAAEDLAQEAFVAAYRRWRDIGGYDDPGAWVRRVVANSAVSLRRRARVEADALVRRRRVDRYDDEASIEHEHLWVEVRRLPRRQAQVIALHYVERRTTADIAALLGLSEATVKTHLQRARATLATRLER
jgi:RNA polymerase sigma factor (sigma-70 family)